MEPMPLATSCRCAESLQKTSVSCGPPSLCIPHLEFRSICTPSSRLSPLAWKWMSSVSLMRNTKMRCAMPSSRVIPGPPTSRRTSSRPSTMAFIKSQKPLLAMSKPMSSPTKTPPFDPGISAKPSVVRPGPDKPSSRPVAARSYNKRRMRRVVISGPPPVQILDVTGPLEVFSCASGYQVQLVAFDDSGHLPTSRGFSLAGAIPLQHISGPLDTLVIAGGPGAENGHYDDTYIRWVAAMAARSRRVASICTGAFVLAAAGLLDGKTAVTHWSFCDRFAREFPKVKVLSDPIFLRDGAVYTSAGITSGMDLALALVEED